MILPDGQTVPFVINTPVFIWKKSSLKFLFAYSTFSQLSSNAQMLKRISQIQNKYQ